MWCYIRILHLGGKFYKWGLRSQETQDHVYICIIWIYFEGIISKNIKIGVKLTDTKKFNRLGPNTGWSQ